MARYLSILLGVTAALIGGMAAFNVAIDPFDIYRLVEIPYVNAIKTERNSDSSSRIAVSFDILREDYATVFLGNSRVMWTVGGHLDGVPGPILNGGMPEITAFELAAALRLVSARNTARCVFVGLEPEMFSTLGSGKGTYWLSALPDASPSMSRLRLAPQDCGLHGMTVV